MGIEGEGRFERIPDFSRGRESGEGIFLGRTPEQAARPTRPPEAVVSGEAERASWLERYITPERLAEVKASPYGENRSSESLLLERLTGVLVESGPELDPDFKKKLRSFINAFRVAAYPNMRPHEQKLILDIAERTGGWAGQIIDVDEVGPDIAATWQRFGFRIPNVHPGEVGSEFTRFYGKPELEVGKSTSVEVREKSEIPPVTVPAVQVILTREGEDGTEVFLGHRIAGGFLNQWSFPGGRVDEGEDHLQAGRRELREEAGVDVPESSLDFLRDTQSSTVREKGGKKVRYDYKIRVFTVDGQNLSPHNASPAEHSEMRWMSVSDALVMHERAVEDATGESQTPDKIPGALSPRTLETIKFLSIKSQKN